MKNATARKKAKEQKEPEPRKRDVFLVVTDPLLGWLEDKAKSRGETKVQPFIYESLRRLRDAELQTQPA